MHRIHFALISAVMAIRFASIASAGDLPVTTLVFKDPIAAPIYNWTGFYVGGDAGALWTRNSAQWDPLPSIVVFDEFPIAGNLNTTAFVGGLHAGYNWQFAHTWFAGVEVDWSWENASGSLTQPWTRLSTGIVRPATRTSLSINANWLATARGRIGYLVTPRTSAYFTGGFAWGKFDYAASAANETPTYVAPAAFSKTVRGYALGGGLEWALQNNWSLRGEYLFYHLRTTAGVTATDSLGNFPTFPSGFAWSDTNIHSVRAGVGYKF